MKKTFLITLLGATSAMFGQITPNGPWQTVVTPTTVVGEVITSSTATAGTAYWNNGTTDDGIVGNPPGCYNIGCYITGSGVWAGVVPGQVSPYDPAADPLPLANPVYLGNNNGSALSSFTFNGPGVAGGTQMLAEVAGNSDRAWMGWYDTSLTNVTQFTAANRGTAWDVIFIGSQSAGATATFTPTSNFGLFFFDSASPGSPLAFGDTAAIVSAIQGTGGNQGANFTNSNITGSYDAGNQHFAVFATSAAAAGTIPADFWVGAEDTVLASADKDYNDMIVHLRIVPEPGYFVLLSLGLGGLGLVRNRFKKAA